MITRPTQIALLVGALALAGGLGCAQPSSGRTLASRPHTRENSYPPLYLAGGRRNPEAPPPI